MPRPRTNTVHMPTAPAHTYEHARPFICTWPWPKTSPNSRRTGLRLDRAPRTHQQRPPRKTGPYRKDQRALGGKDSYQSISAWQQTAPTSPWYNPMPQPRWGGGPVHQRRQASQSPIHSMPSHHLPQVWSTRTHPAPLPQLEPLGRRQWQYRGVRKVPVNTNHLRVHRQKTRVLV